MDPTLLDIELRRPLITRYLSSLTETEVVCLQEVGLSEFQHLARALGPEFQGAMARNDPDFWSNWLVPGYPWEPNGPAIFASTESFDEITIRDVPLGTGNHAAVLEATHAATGRTVRAWSVHLDSDRTTNRLAEVDTLLAETESDLAATDVICGDLNDDTVVGSIAPRLRRAGFVDIHAALGIRQRTHPWSEQYYSSDRWAIIDHVLVRNGEPTAASIVDAGVDSNVDELTRIEEFLRRMGSDHYSITATVRLANPTRNT